MPPYYNQQSLSRSKKEAVSLIEAAFFLDYSLK